MGIEGQESPRDVASEDKRHPWEVLPNDETSTKNDGRKERNENKEDNKFISWVKTHKLLSAGIVLAVVAVIVGGIVGFNILRKNGVFGGNTQTTEEDVKGIGIDYDEYLNLLSLEKSSPENAFDYALGTLKPILVEGIYNSETGVDYTKLEDNFEVFIKKVEKPEEKICYRLAMIYTMYRLGDRAPQRADGLLELFDEEKNELNRTQKYFYLMVQVEHATAAGDIEKAKTILAQIDEEYPVDEGYVDIDTGEEITDPDELERIKQSFENNKKEGE